jgi:hypothetical protein
MEQPSTVQGLPSSGTSVSSGAGVVPPLPSHTSCWQSPAVCVARTVPCGAATTPHTPAVQVRCAHAVSVPGQSAASTQAPGEPPVPVEEDEEGEPPVPDEEVEEAVPVVEVAPPVPDELLDGVLPP